MRRAPQEPHPSKESTQAAVDVNVDKFIDCKGLRCPMPIVKVKRALKPLEIGQVVEMIATDPGVIPDMEAWERQTNHKVLLAETLADGVFRFLVEKTH